MNDLLSTAVQSSSQASAGRGVPEPVYQHLSTDFYPWSEVIADLKARSQSGQSLLFQACSPAAQADFVWQAGRLLGGYSGPHDLSFAALMRNLPRAHVSLMPLNEAAAGALWAHRAAQGQTLRGTATRISERLADQSGILSSMGAGRRSVCLWEGGAPRWGYWDEASPAQEWHFVSLGRNPDVGELSLFWGQVLSVTHRRAALDEAWRQAALGLSTRHPVLDPFLREVTVRTGELHVDPQVEAAELQPALLDTYRAALVRLGLQLSDLPLDTLRAHKLWEPSGLAALERRQA